MTQAKILDLGCGQRKIPGAVGVDAHPLEGVDVVHDLTVFPYPIPDNSYDRIVLRHVIEHVPDTIRLMQEIHRIGRSGARVEIHTPHYTSCNSYMDPTHIHHFSLQAFDFFCGGTVHDHVPTSRFRMMKREVDFWPIRDSFSWSPYDFLGLRWLASKHPNFYERFLTFLFPIKEFRVELEVVK